MVSEVFANSHHFVAIAMACNVFKSVISQLGKLEKNYSYVSRLNCRRWSHKHANQEHY